MFPEIIFSWFKFQPSFLLDCVNPVIVLRGGMQISMDHRKDLRLGTIWDTEKKRKNNENCMCCYRLVLCPLPVFRLLASGASYTDQIYCRERTGIHFESIQNWSWNFVLRKIKYQVYVYWVHRTSWEVLSSQLSFKIRGSQTDEESCPLSLTPDRSSKSACSVSPWFLVLLSSLEPSEITWNEGGLRFRT